MLNKRSYILIIVSIVFAFIAGATKVSAVLQLAHIVSEIFMKLLKLISGPIISLSLLSAISSIGENSFSLIGKRIVTYTIFTTIIASFIGLILYLIVQPVAIAVQDVVPVMQQSNFVDEFLKVIPNNLIQPFLEGHVVSTMLISLVVGLAITKLPHDKRMQLHDIIGSLFHVMMQLTRWIVSFMPLAMWGFMTTFVVDLSNGLPYQQIGLYLITILLANIIQAGLVLPLLLKFRGVSPKQAFVHMLPALSFAFFSKSSSAAMPLAIDCAEQRLNVDQKIARFSFPLCTSINMNACAAFIIITVMFVAESQGVSFTFVDRVTWILLATVAAIGNAGVPMGCFFIASALLTNMNLSLALMGIILPFYALLDMLESAINIWSDACVTLVVDKENQIPERVVEASVLG